MAMDNEYREKPWDEEGISREEFMRRENAKNTTGLPPGEQVVGSSSDGSQQIVKRADGTTYARPTPKAGGGGTTGGGAAAPGGAVGKGGGALPITRGEYDDYYAVARQVMRQLGLVSREPSDAEIVQFAQGKVTAEGISDFYSFLPEFVSQNPGLPYGLTKEDYQQRVSGFQSAFGGVFGSGQSIGAPSPPLSKMGRESDLMGFALTKGLSSGQFAGTLEQFRTERGRAPNVGEFSERFSRPPSVTRGSGAAASADSGTGTETGGRGRSPRPAVAG